MEVKIFATLSDLESSIDCIESKIELICSKTGLFSSEEIQYFDSIMNIEEIGVNHTGKYITGTSIIVCEKNDNINAEKIKQKKGGYLYSIGQSNNPNSIIFQPGGIFQNKYIVRGGIGTVSNTKKSIELFKYFKKTILKDFKKIKDWYVGPEALLLAKAGYRLITMHVEQSIEYDLLVD